MTVTASSLRMQGDLTGRRMWSKGPAVRLIKRTFFDTGVSRLEGGISGRRHPLNRTRSRSAAQDLLVEQNTAGVGMASSACSEKSRRIT